MSGPPVTKVFPPLPAATLGMLHVGWPHGHMHPPSFIPPAPPQSSRAGALREELA